MAKRGPKGGSSKRRKKKKAGSSIPAVEADVGKQDFLARERVATVTKDLHRLVSSAKETDAQATKLEQKAAEIARRAKRERKREKLAAHSNSWDC